MNIKSLILGSATVALATAGAHAADAIVIAEPEPVEYVRVCDVYGAGFFYIPGTETCLRIGGEARVQIGASSDNDANDTPNLHGHEADTWNVESRGRFYLDARSQTEWGTLRGYIRVDASRGGFGVANSANNIRTNKAFVELGGFKVGFEDSAWAFTPNAGAANYGSHSDSALLYGYQQRNLIQYNFSGSNGFFATLSLEDDNRNQVAPAIVWDYTPVPPTVTVIPGYADNNYVPDVVLKAGVNQAWGAAWAAFGYDEDRTSASTIAAVALGAPVSNIGDSGWAGQLGVHLNVPSAPGSSFRLIGYYADSDNAYNGHGGKWSILGSYWHQFNAQFGASIGVQYIDNLYVPGTDTTFKTAGLGKIDAWALELNTVWEPVQNFQIRTETVYQKADELDGTLSGFVRFSRFF